MQENIVANLYQVGVETTMGHEHIIKSTLHTPGEKWESKTGPKKKLIIIIWKVDCVTYIKLVKQENKAIERRRYFK